MGELGNEIKKLCKNRTVDLHGSMLSVEDDTMLVIVRIGRILNEPGASVDGQGNDPMILAGGRIETSRVSFVFPTKKALGVGGLGGFLCGGDGFGILFRLGKVNRNIQIAVFRMGNPFQILGNPITADYPTKKYVKLNNFRGYARE